MDFKIKHIKIENFRCFDRFESDLWDNTVVCGDNESGKSTIATAVLWCLTGKDVEGNSNFEIVPSNKYGKVSPCVTLECSIDEKPVTLAREYKAKLARDKSFKEYATICYINGLENGARKFQEYISTKICSDNVFKILSNPYTFVENCPKEQKELLWQAQRRMLMGLIETESDEDIASDGEKWSPIKESLVRYDDVNQYLSFLKQETSKCQKEVSAFESKLEQQIENTTEVSCTKEEAETKINELQKEIDSIDKKIEEKKNSSSSKKIAKIMGEIEELQRQKDDIERPYLVACESARNDAETAKQTIDRLNRMVSENAATQSKYAEAVKKLEHTKISEYCETCGQRLTAQAINKSKAMMATRIKSGKEYVEKARANGEKLTSEIESLTQKLNSAIPPVYPVEAIEISEKINSLKESLCAVPENSGSSNKKLEEQKKEIKYNIAIMNEKLYDIQRNEYSNQKIKELKENHAKNNEKLNELQMLTDLCKEFITYKCSKYEKKINSLFDTVKFQLFEQNKSNDDIREVCNMTYNGHKYEDLSASTKLIASLEVMDAFQKYYNSYVPIVIDNMESVTANIKNDAQVIKMYVKEERCPFCGGESGRRAKSGNWTCKDCGKSWSKELLVKEG